MNKAKKPTKVTYKPKKKIQIAFIGGMPDFVDSLRDVDLNSPDVNLNETSIGDNNGGRIILGEDGENVVKK